MTPVEQSRLVRATEAATQVPFHMVAGPNRSRPVTDARRLFAAGARGLVKDQPTLKRIGQIVGRDHSSVVHHLRVHKALLESGDAEYTPKWEKLKAGYGVMSWGDFTEPTREVVFLAFVESVNRLTDEALVDVIGRKRIKRLSLLP